MTNVHDILEKVRAAQQRLPPNEAAVLFAAAVRLAAAQGATLRSRLLQIDDSGGLHLSPFDDQAPEAEPGYLAPELRAADAPRKSEPRVQVYAAGALGFELLTGHRAPGNLAELGGPLGDIVRMALAPDRRERFGDLTQLHDAVEGVQPRPPAEGERNILSALRTRWTRVAPEKEAVAKLIEKLTHLEQQVAALAKAQARVDAAQRQTQEQLDRFAEGQQRLATRKEPSALGPALLGALLAAAAVILAGWALGLVPARAQQAPVAVQPLPQPAPPVEEKKAAPAAEERKAAPPAEEKKAAPAPPPKEEASAKEVDAGAVAVVADGGAPDASVAAAPTADAGTVAAAEPPPRPKKKEREQPVTQAQLLHAVAVSQVRRGESALEKGRADEALESFRAALENEATLAVAFRGLGMAYAMQGNDTQALQAYEKYLQLAPLAPDKADIKRSITELKSRSKIGGGEK